MAKNTVYEFHAELTDSEPLIWRKFRVKKDITLAKFGYILQVLFEMQANHLFQFVEPYQENFYAHMSQSFPLKEVKKQFPPNKVAERRFYELQNHLTEDFNDPNAFNALTTNLSDVFCLPGAKLKMWYDFGDDWFIDIKLVEEIEDSDIPAGELPQVLEGEGFGILEDCGGVFNLNQAISEKEIVMENMPEVYEAMKLLFADFNTDDMNLRLKKLPRIYANCYVRGTNPSKASLDFMARKYLK
ncbi:MAG: plasmid pRiA4b ORF-3 family protein [Eubacteriales bacterium]